MSKKKFLGDKIALHRTKLKLNRQKFIDQLNDQLNTKYTSQALYSWEKGVSIPPADLLPPLAHLLHISILELYGMDALEAEKTVSDNTALAEEVKQLREKVSQQDREILKLEGKVEASEAFVDKLMGLLNRSK